MPDGFGGYARSVGARDVSEIGVLAIRGRNLATLNDLIGAVALDSGGCRVGKSNNARKAEGCQDSMASNLTKHFDPDFLLNALTRKINVLWVHLLMTSMNLMFAGASVKSRFGEPCRAY